MYIWIPRNPKTSFASGPMLTYSYHTQQICANIAKNDAMPHTAVPILPTFWRIRNFWRKNVDNSSFHLEAGMYGFFVLLALDHDKGLVRERGKTSQSYGRAHCNIS
jgi:hypothetical protein